MQNIFGETLEQHDPALLWLAAAVLVAGSIATFRIQRQCASGPHDLRRLWRATAGLTGGASLWTAHFVALLAHGGVAQAAFDPVRALMSLVAGVGAYSALYFFAAGRRDRPGRVVIAAALGPAAAAVHWMQVAALNADAFSVSPGTLALSALVGTVGGGLAAVVAGSGRNPWRMALCLLSASAGVAGLHVVAMSTHGTAAHPLAAGSASLSGQAVGLAATVVVICVVGLGLTAAWLAARSREHALGTLQAALDALPAGVALFDRNDRLVLWNDPYAVQGGAARAVLAPGRSFRAMLEAGVAAGSYPDAVGREEDWVAERLDHRRRECDVEQLDGESWLRLQDRRTPDGGVVSIATDITGLKRQAEILAEARDRAEAANRAKDVFLANMSHELRTPLNGVVAVAEVLAKTDLDAQQRELVALIESSSRTLTAVLSDVLDLARIEAGALELSAEPLSPGDLVREVANFWRSEAERKGLALAVDVAPSAEGGISGDPVRLRQVLGNLTSNAVKFTAQGGVRLRAWRSPASPEVLHLEVEDTGVGFDPEQATALFERFRQADGSIVRRFGGTGLGLAICRELILRMGGAIDAEGRPGSGATFRVALPAPVIDVGEPDAPAGGAAAASALSERSLAVLVAEDHPVNRKVVDMILTSVGARITAVEDGQAALDAFKRQPFDAVLMDMQMPVMDGLSATRAIRAWEREHAMEPTPVIVLTANAMPEHIASALAAGGDRHLSKPVSAAGLLDALAQLTEAAAAKAA